VLLLLASEDDGGLAKVASTLAMGLPGAGVGVAVALQRDGRTCEELRGAGLAVHVVPELIETLDRGPDGRSSSGAVLRNLAAAPRAVAAVRALAGRHGARLLYSHGSWPNHIAAEASRRGGLHAVWHIHTAFSRLNGKIARIMARRGRLASIIGVSQSVLGPYRDFGPPCEVIYNGVDLEACDRAAAAPALRRRLGLAPQAFVFGYAGRLVPHKGVDVLKEAARRVLLELPQAQFVLLGANPTSSGRDVVGDLRRFFASAGLSARAHIPGYQPDALAWIADMDLLLVPSIYADPCPLSVLEGLALGTPVVGSAIGGIPELIEHEKTGLLVPPGEAAAIASCVVALAARPDRLKAMSEQARLAARVRFDGRAMVRTAAGALARAGARP
jgi:glycosyltransferase involved in cell wall biosynthesis